MNVATMNERVPSLNVYRPVLNVDEHMLKLVMEACVAENIQVPEIPEELQAVLIGPGHLRMMHEGLDASPDLHTVEDLAGHILGYLPPSADETIHIPTMPFTRNTHRRGRKALAAGSNNPVSAIERSVAATLVRAYHSDPSLPWPWGSNENDGRVELGRFRSDYDEAAVAAFEELLIDHPGLLPGELELGPVDIDVMT